MCSGFQPFVIDGGRLGIEYFAHAEGDSMAGPSRTGSVWVQFTPTGFGAQDIELALRQLAMY